MPNDEHMININWIQYESVLIVEADDSCNNIAIAMPLQREANVILYFTCWVHGVIADLQLSKTK